MNALKTYICKGCDHAVDDCKCHDTQEIVVEKVEEPDYKQMFAIKIPHEAMDDFFISRFKKDQTVTLGKKKVNIPEDGLYLIYYI